MCIGLPDAKLEPNGSTRCAFIFIRLCTHLQALHEVRRLDKGCYAGLSLLQNLATANIKEALYGARGSKEYTMPSELPAVHSTSKDIVKKVISM